MSGHERVNRVLGRLAETLLESGAKVGLNAVQALLEEVRGDAYEDGFEDAIQTLDHRDNEAADRAYHQECGDG